MDIYAILASKPHDSYFLKHYFTFIQSCCQANSGKTKQELGYTENHHICPKAKDLFPEYSKFSEHPWNKAVLTAEQHFIAHKLLWKAYGGSQTGAFWLISNCNSTPLTPITYAKLRKDKAELTSIQQKGRVKSEQELKNMSIAQKGRKQSPEEIKKRVEKNTGQKRTNEQLERMSNSQKGRSFSPETKAKMSEIAKNRKFSDETKSKMSETKRSKDVHKFIHDKTNSIFIGTRHEFQQKFGFMVGPLFMKVPRETINGWRVEPLLDTSSEVHHKEDQNLENFQVPC